MMLDEHFELLHRRIKLTKKQKEDVSTKVNSVSRSLYAEFYEDDYDDSKKLIVGSHGKKTETRYPVGDIDLIFKISKEDLDRYMAYESNGPSALLTRVKNKLSVTYPNSEIHNWGKVVLVRFGDGQHDVEVIPCYEQEDKTFIVPDSENDGDWPVIDYRKEMRMIAESQSTTQKTRKLIKMIKRWNRKANKPLKSYQIEFFCVGYLDEMYREDLHWSEIIEGFFVWLEQQSDDPEFDDSALTKVARARGRAQKARDYELDEKYGLACQEWRKVFGQPFPVYDPDLSTVSDLERRYSVDGEEFIHDRYSVKIDPAVTLTITPHMKRNGFRDYLPFVTYFTDGVRYLPKQASLVFKLHCNLGRQANYYWKIRNFGDEALRKDVLRGEIIKDTGTHTRNESTAYNGTHYVECYAIVNSICVAVTRCFVPIYEENV